jgi:hypothetical protein
MKPSAIRIERMLEKIEARVSPRKRLLSFTIHEGDDEGAAMEKALAEHVAAILKTPAARLRTSSG